MSKLIRIQNIIMTFEEWVLKFKKSMSIKIKREMPMKSCKCCEKNQPKHIDFFTFGQPRYLNQQPSWGKCRFTTKAREEIVFHNINAERSTLPKWETKCSVPMLTFKTYYGYRKEGLYCSAKCANNMVREYTYDFVKEYTLTNCLAITSYETIEKLAEHQKKVIRVSGGGEWSESEGVAEENV